MELQAGVCSHSLCGALHALHGALPHLGLDSRPLQSTVNATQQRGRVGGARAGHRRREAHFVAGEAVAGVAVQSIRKRKPRHDRDRSVYDVLHRTAPLP